MSDAVTVPDAVAEAPWRGVHPASVLVNLVPRSWSVLRNAWPLLLAMLYGGRSAEGLAEGFVNLLTLAVFFGLAFGSALVHALTLRYRVNDGRLEIRTGLVNRQARVIACDRVQNVERVQNVFQRASGLVEVRVETASGKEVEGLLSAISVSEADALIAAIDAGRAAVPAADEPPPQVLLESSVVDLLWRGAADMRLGAVGVLIVAAIELVPGLSQEDMADAGMALGGLGFVLIVVAVVTGSWLFGIGTAVIRYWGFTLSRGPGSLIAVFGLLTRRRAELRRNKVQLVTWSQPMLLRPVGLGSLAIETAAAREAGSGTQRSEAVVPIVTNDQVASLLGEALPAISSAEGIDPVNVVLTPPHPRARTLLLLRSAVRSGILATALAVWFFPHGLFALLLVPLNMLLTRLDIDHQGFAITQTLVIARRGVLTRTTALVARHKLQSATISQGIWLRRRGLGVLTLRVAGSRVDLPMLSWDDAVALQQSLTSGLRR